MKGLELANKLPLHRSASIQLKLSRAYKQFSTAALGLLRLLVDAQGKVKTPLNIFRLRAQAGHGRMGTAMPLPPGNPREGSLDTGPV